MKTILCFGDSNTWGYSPSEPRRYTEQERWPTLLQARLPSGYRIIEEGQNGRNTVLDDPFDPGKKGLDYLLPCLETHHPDYVIILLGTNDLKSRFNLTASDISKGAARLVQVTQSFKHAYMEKAPEVLLIAPPHVYEADPNKEGFTGAEEKSKQLGHFYRLRANELGCHFFDASSTVTPCEKEGLHWHVDQHIKLADKLAQLIPEIFAQ
ncbi:SGNH/GDSL hydrolase family protein [Vibrio hippocampi]|uniref:SGNH hydrolase-type esterase domain-containing protein n=1 Tax=Vibrio hippocampi TaxID=654686 RepID=A0ABN8DK79_9VIBR|nr:SGNH/GDSL hydrolase family protein [Vibrio hippocampi]CAH0529505.1 hypothetical protein VHP8226_03259 [Vibrio hippocampi]